jgi:hypothetical protein
MHRTCLWCHNPAQSVLCFAKCCALLCSAVLCHVVLCRSIGLVAAPGHLPDLWLTALFGTGAVVSGSKSSPGRLGLLCSIESVPHSVRYIAVDNDNATSGPRQQVSNRIACVLHRLCTCVFVPGCMM